MNAARTRFSAGASGASCLLLLACLTPLILGAATEPSVCQDRSTQMPCQLIGQVKAATVYVYVEYPTLDGMANGSGFFVSDDGLVLTNWHVVSGMFDVNGDGVEEGPFPINVLVYTGSGTATEVEYPAEVIARGGDDLDLALLQVELPEPCEYLRLDKAQELVETQTVWAVGFPLGIEDISIRQGAISRFIHDDDGVTVFIEHTATLSTGNSGGPLVTESGRVIGINTVVAGELLNTYLAISGDQALKFLDDHASGALPPITPVEEHEWASSIAFEQGQYERAIAELEQAVSLDPENASLYSDLGWAYFNAGYSDDAVTTLEEALQLDPDWAWPRCLLGAVLGTQGRYDEAVATLQEAADLDPEDATAHHLLGMVYEDMGLNRKALAAYQESIRRNPADPDPYDSLGLLYFKLERYDEAIAILEEALLLDPQYADPHCSLGQIYFALDAYDEAEVEFLAAIRLDPSFPAAHYHLGNVYAIMERYNDAISAYKQAIMLNPQYMEPHYLLGLLLEDLGRYGEAMAEYNAVIRLSPDFADVYADLGDVYYYGLGNLEEALNSYEQALSLNANLENGHFRLGNVCYDLGLYEEAATRYQLALVQNPDDPLAHFNLAKAYDMLDRYAQAIAEFKKALRLQPDFPEAHNDLGLLYGRLERYEEAVAEFETAIALNPDYALAHYNLGLAHISLDNTTQALAAFRRALDLSAPGEWIYEDAQEYIINLGRP